MVFLISCCRRRNARHTVFVFRVVLSKVHFSNDLYVLHLLYTETSHLSREEAEEQRASRDRAKDSSRSKSKKRHSLAKKPGTTRLIRRHKEQLPPGSPIDYEGNSTFRESKQRARESYGSTSETTDLEESSDESEDETTMVSVRASTAATKKPAANPKKKTKAQKKAEQDARKRKRDDTTESESGYETSDSFDKVSAELQRMQLEMQKMKKEAAQLRASNPGAFHPILPPGTSAFAYPQRGTLALKTDKPTKDKIDEAIQTMVFFRKPLIQVDSDVRKATLLTYQHLHDKTRRGDLGLDYQWAWMEAYSKYIKQKINDLRGQKMTNVRKCITKKSFQDGKDSVPLVADIYSFFKGCLDENDESQKEVIIFILDVLIPKITGNAFRPSIRRYNALNKVISGPKDKVCNVFRCPLPMICIFI